MIHPPAFDKPLTFGDREQIAAVRKFEQDVINDALRQDFEALTDCFKCDGMGTCWHCEQECPDCEGSGKDQDAVEAFMEKHPDFETGKMLGAKDRTGAKRGK